MEFLDPTRYEVIGRKYFQPNIDPIDSQELTNIQDFTDREIH